MEAGQIDVARALVGASTTERGGGVSGTEAGGGGDAGGASGAPKDEEVGAKAGPSKFGRFFFSWLGIVGRSWQAVLLALP